MAHVDALFRDLNVPDLEALIRGASTSQKRQFTLACVRLAARNTDLADPDISGVDPSIVSAILDAAESLLDGAAASVERARAARLDAEALMKRLDEAQLDISGQIQEEAQGEGDRILRHPRYPAYVAAFRRFCAASALACTVQEDALEAAAQCTYELERGIHIDAATILAIAYRAAGAR